MANSFSIINEAQVDVFLKFPCFLYDPANVGYLISGSSAFSKPSFTTWKFLVHITLKPSLTNFERNFTSIGDECNCPVVWTCFSTALLGNWNEDWSFLVLWLEKAMAPHSSTLAWEIPWTEEPGRLQSMGLLRVGQDWTTSLSLFTFMHWRRKWQPTPVFLPGESQGRGNLVGSHLWGRTESDTTEAT